jgi:flagellar protein FlbD
MIRITRLDGSELLINADLIEFIETTPDTVLSLLNNKKMVVKEPAEEIVRRVIAYKRRILSGPVQFGEETCATIGANREA